MGEHNELTSIHVIHDYTYANAAARTGATGFVSGDVGKVAKQTDTSEWYILTATTPTWQLIGSGGGDGDVVGPGPTVTDDAIARMDGTGGYTIDESGITITDANIMTFPDTHLVRPILKDYGKEVYAHGSTSGAVALNMENGNIQTITVTGSTTLSITNPTPSGDHCAVTVIITQDGTGSHVVTLPTANWAGASSPTLSTGPNDIDILTFVTLDAGSTWFGFVDGLDMS
jgi:hypothetical protein